jgi:hypothetical protein
LFDGSDGSRDHRLQSHNNDLEVHMLGKVSVRSAQL